MQLYGSRTLTEKQCVSGCCVTCIRGAVGIRIASDASHPVSDCIKSEEQHSKNDATAPKKKRQHLSDLYSTRTLRRMRPVFVGGQHHPADSGDACMTAARSHKHLRCDIENKNGGRNHHVRFLQHLACVSHCLLAQASMDFLQQTLARPRRLTTSLLTQMSSYPGLRCDFL